LKENKVEFIPIVEAIYRMDKFYGHKEIDAKGDLVKSIENFELKVAHENDFVLVNNKEIPLIP